LGKDFLIQKKCDEIHKIKRITVYQCDLPLKEGSYNWSSGKSVSVFDSTIIQIDTDTGYTGFGEIVPLGPFYLPSYALGVRSGMNELAPKLIGLNAIDFMGLNQFMDLALKGHPYIKSPIDMACWDIFGKITELPLVSLLGGRQTDKVMLYRAISQTPPNIMAKNVGKYKDEGYTKFQLKVGGTVDDDIERIKLCRRDILDSTDILVADANTGWLPYQAMQIVRETNHNNLDVFIEEPCATFEENCQIRKFCNNPFIMDECINDINTIIDGCYNRNCDIVNLKISKLGGITKAKQARDLLISLNIPMCIEDTWGGDINTSAIAHMAQSTPIKFQFSATDFNSYNTVKNANGSPQRIDGSFKASEYPGLGIEPIKDVIGDPVAVYQADNMQTK